MDIDSSIFSVALRCLVSLLKGLFMARGRTTSLTIRLTPAERQTLQAWQRATTNQWR